MSGELVQLPDLAARINQHHLAAVQHIGSALEHARLAGEALLLAKKACAHGTWLTWLKENVGVSERSAQGYMRVAREWERLGANPRPVADLGVRGALQLLADTRDQDAATTYDFGPEVSELGAELHRTLADGDERVRAVARSVQAIRSKLTPEQFEAWCRSKSRLDREEIEAYVTAALQLNPFMWLNEWAAGRADKILAGAGLLNTQDKDRKDDTQ